jgi:glycosyltransferase involved in cell wall biosynthesis
MDTKISFITFTRNSGRKLELLLENVKDVVDEIIVVDGFSNDDTVEIAISYAAKVFRESLGAMWNLIECLL